MKKKFLALATAVCLTAPIALSATGCGASGPARMNESAWKSHFDEVNFSLTWIYPEHEESRRAGEFRIAENSYYIQTFDSDNYIYTYYEYGKETVNGQNSYYKYQIYGISEDEETVISAEEYTDYHDELKPLTDFFYNNYQNFAREELSEKAYYYNKEADAHFAVYTGELPEAVKAIIEGFIGIEYNHHSIRAFCEYDRISSIYFMEEDPIFHGDSYNINNWSVQLTSFGEIESNKEVKQGRLNRKVNKALDELTDFENGSNFKVVGGKGVDYIEMYFTKNGMRMYTPNNTQPTAEGEPVYVDGIYFNDNGTYRYYKKTLEGVWSVEPIDKERYDSTIEQFYNFYGGGVFLEEKVHHNRNSYEGRKPNTWTLWSVNAKLGYLDAYFHDVLLHYDKNEKITKVTWNADIEPLVGNTLKYNYTLTVGKGSFEIPTV